MALAHDMHGSGNLPTLGTPALVERTLADRDRFTWRAATRGD